MEKPIESQPRQLNLCLVNKNSYKQFKKLRNYIKPEIEKHVDLRLFAKLQKCLASNFKGAPFVKKAVTLAQQFYETEFRAIKTVKYGCSIPMNPEILQHAMFLAKNEIVLEIAGARGENAALLAFSGAKRVYMNDIDSGEVESFKDLCNELPSQVQEKIEPILGNCLELLELKPELKGTVGLVLCNNLIHFFNDKELEEFFKLLKTILRPGGQAIFTANAIYQKNDFKEISELHPENTVWKDVKCLLHDYFQGSMPIGILYNSILREEDSNANFLDYKDYPLWSKTVSTQWVENKSGYQQLPSETAKKLEAVVNENIENIKKTISFGKVRLLINKFRLFQEKNISKLFKENGFEVEQTLLINGKNGHLFFGDDPYNNTVSKVGIIIRAPKKNI